jgi:hypothetical protein
MTQMLSVGELRDLAMNYLDVATDGARGRAESDPMYKAITEARDFGKGYSSCGDLVHWLFYRLGVRANWLNRKEFNGWKSGKNLSRLAFDCPDGRMPRHSETFEAGDVLIVWAKTDATDAHVLIVRDHDGEVLHSADGGQPGIARRERAIKADSFMLSTKPIKRVLKFRDLIEGAFTRGQLVNPEPLGDWLMKVQGKAKATVALPELPTLRISDKPHEEPPVRELQTLLNKRGASLLTDGWFGPKTHAAVCQFQVAHGLQDDGIVDRLTWEVLLS